MKVGHALSSSIGRNVMCKIRRGSAAVEMLLVIATFVFASFAFMKLGWAVIEAFFGDGNQLTAIPLF